MKALFYPGCSIQRSSRPYLDSIEAIQPILELELEEVRDWNCCGATEYMSVHRLGAQALIGRNLALAQQQVNGTRTLVAACSACYLNLAKTEHYMRSDKALAGTINAVMAEGELHYDPGTLEIRHLLDIITTDIGIAKIKSLVTRPLKGLRVAPYYGCMIARPDLFNRSDDPEYPQAMDRLLGALGAEVIDFPLKTHCCGGHMTQINPETAFELIRRLLDGANQYEAALMVTVCPMCQLNLDAYQEETNKFFGLDYHVPILYFTQLIGLAFGLEAEVLGIGKEFIQARDALAAIGVEVPEAGASEAGPPKPRKPRKKDEGLPMPVMPSENGED